MIDIGTVLRHYKRREIQDEMANAAAEREVAVKYGEKGFGKRPDTLKFPKDVLEFAKQRVTSFHVSEERWFNPLHLDTGLKPKELDEMRKGWDLVLDVDIPDWKLSKIITWLLIKALREKGIKSVSCKFSGNKGFHIAVPFEAFPRNVGNEETRKMFPDICKKISFLLIDYIGKNHTSYDEIEETVSFGGHYTFTMKYLAEKLGKGNEELLKKVCSECNKKITSLSKEKEKEYECNCGEVIILENEYTKCTKCFRLISKEENTKKSVCKCGSTKYHFEFEPLSVIEVDTILISSRHMFRMVYSLHEKSGLCSVPVDCDKILMFKKENAHPDALIISGKRFLDGSSANGDEGSNLLEEAMVFSGVDDELEERESQYKESRNANTTAEIEEIEEEIPEDFFPPCIHCLLKGLSDGRKRAMFILINFLSNTGYGWGKVEDIVFNWNKKNEEELREVIIKGQIRYRKNKGKILPPNCDNNAYYKDLGVCDADNFCRKIKNPVNYAIIKAKSENSKGKKGRQKLTDEQKEMRRRWRQKKKENQDKAN